ncbi:MAG: hypothetical protein HY885_15640 [Deltaproteobacteria bacterium]|nr:hypothetical protein [Deltaproteobacteria bacterium]
MNQRKSLKKFRHARAAHGKETDTRNHVSFLQNDDKDRFVIPGKRSATRNPLCFLDSRFRGNDGRVILFHFARAACLTNNRLQVKQNLAISMPRFQRNDKVNGIRRLYFFTA